MTNAEWTSVILLLCREFDLDPEELAASLTKQEFRDVATRKLLGRKLCVIGADWDHANAKFSCFCIRKGQKVVRDIEQVTVRVHCARLHDADIICFHALGQLECEKVEGDREVVSVVPRPPNKCTALERICWLLNCFPNELSERLQDRYNRHLAQRELYQASLSTNYMGTWNRQIKYSCLSDRPASKQSIPRLEGTLTVEEYLNRRFEKKLDFPDLPVAMEYVAPTHIRYYPLECLCYDYERDPLEDYCSYY